jgi:hypothetical protein
MNAIVRHEEYLPLSAADVRQHKNLIAQVVQSVMKEGVHYGVIPGTDKPSLYQQGADCLLTTFRIAPAFRVEEMSRDGEIRFRVTCVGSHQGTGVTLGEGLGECSTGEEKYKWRRAVCDEEWDETPETRRRVKFAKGRNNTIYKNKQVRAEPADVANTVLKMAAKRAKVAMTLNVTGASDFFTQDVEDLPTELRPENENQEPVIPEAPEGAQPILAKLQEAAAKGMESLSAAFNQVPASKVRTWVWTFHGASLKATAQKVAEVVQ